MNERATQTERELARAPYGWAIVQLFGQQTIAGHTRPIDLLGVQALQIDVPAARIEREHFDDQLMAYVTRVEIHPAWSHTATVRSIWGIEWSDERAVTEAIASDRTVKSSIPPLIESSSPKNVETPF